jgi:hypothetical protein
VSDSTEGRDWLRMQHSDFTGRTKTSQDALFLVDEPDACGTEVLDGLGFGAALWADQPDKPPADADPLAAYPRRAVEPDGTVHAARYAGDRQHFTTACALYPAPTVDRLEHGSYRKVICPGCISPDTLVAQEPVRFEEERPGVWKVAPQSVDVFEEQLSQTLEKAFGMSLPELRKQVEEGER